MSRQLSASLGFLSEQAPQAVMLHLQASCHAEASGTQPSEGRRQQLTCEAGCEEITAGHVLDGHARLALQKARHKLRLELLGGSWERRASRSTHRRSLAERSHVSCCTSVQQELGWRTQMRPFPQAEECYPHSGLDRGPGGRSTRAYALSRNISSSEISYLSLSRPLPAPVASSLTSHMMSRPDLVTPAFCVLPAETCTTSVLSMGRRRGVVIPLPQV